jgi:penicillin amidase
MDLVRRLFGLALGRRPPVAEGVLSVPGVTGEIAIRRDSYGIPHITAASDDDAWFALGFCQGQDRSFQIETLTRVVRGTTAELIGSDVVDLDRLARRIGFLRAAEAQQHQLHERERRGIEAFAAGVNAGRDHGSSSAAHEFALLRRSPTPFTAADCLGIFLLQAFSLASNWDAELARLAVFQLDGPEALKALDPGYPEWHPVTSPPGTPAGPAVAGLADDIARLRAALGGGGSNNWAVAGSRTTSGRPIMANDPHLAPVLPSHWYLAHAQAPEWSAAGAMLTGTPGFGSAHNGHVAWGVTAGLVDNTDLFLEKIGPDGRSVLRGEQWIECEVRRETIEVRRASPIVEEVLVTPHGPIVGPAMPHTPDAISMAATWLRPSGVSALFELVRARTTLELRDALADWHGPPLNVAFADADGSIGWKLAGEAPLRKRGIGAIPAAGWDLDYGWLNGRVPFEDMPEAFDPESGYLATANNRPTAEDDPSLGVDWIDGHRITRINELLAPRSDWDVPSTLRMQLDTVTPLWDELADTLLAIEPRDDSAVAHRLLSGWDGDLGSESAAGSVFVLWLVEMERRVAFAKAPISADFVVGRGFAPAPLNPNNMFAFSRAGHLVRLLRERPDGWFADWDTEIRGALRIAEQILRSKFGDDPNDWKWGDVRPLTLRHALGEQKPLDRIFNIGPIRWSGDFSTVSQSGAPPLNPLGNPSAIASLRMAVDVGNWDASRFSLPGGQSGNPVSPHYGDQVGPWSTGTGVPMPFSEEAVAEATTRALFLVPLEP